MPTACGADSCSQGLAAEPLTVGTARPSMPGNDDQVAQGNSDAATGKGPGSRVYDCDQVTPRIGTPLPPPEVSCASLGDLFVFTAVPKDQAGGEALT